MDIKLALSNLQGLTDEAVKRGIFGNAASVINAQQSLECVAQTITALEKKVTDLESKKLPNSST